MFGLLIIGFVVIFVAILVLIYWAWQRSSSKYAQLWSTIAGIVNGTSKGSSLTGSYQGMPVVARIQSTGDETSTSYQYTLQLSPGGQGKQWSASYTGDKLLGLGEKAWRIKSKDEALVQRLMAAGVTTLLESYNGQPGIDYQPGKNVLSYRVQTRNAYAVPAPELFQAQLDLLTKLAEINRQVNVG